MFGIKTYLTKYFSTYGILNILRLDNDVLKLNDLNRFKNMYGNILEL